MPKVAGKYAAVVTIRKRVMAVEAESKEHAIRTMLLALASTENRTDFEHWVTGGMQIELV